MWRSEHTSNTADLETGANLRRQLALSPAQNNVQELLLSRHRRDILPGRLHLGRSGFVLDLSWKFFFFISIKKS